MRIYLLFVTGLYLVAQPVITPKGVANSAGFQPMGVPGGPIARGSTFSIFGSGLGPAATAQQPSYPLQPSIGGVSVKVTQGATNLDALPVFVADTLVNAIMPSNTPLGQVSVRVTYNGQTSNPQTVTVVNTNPGLFTSTGLGAGPGSIQNLSPDGQAPLNSPLRTAQPGQYVTLWGTGLGPISQPDANTPPIGDLPTQVEIWVGGVPVSNFIYKGRTPCCAGIDQIVFQVPSNVPSGCYVPVVVRAAGTQVGNAVTMAIGADPAQPCSDPANPVSLAAVKGGAVGIVVLEHQTVLEDIVISPAQSIASDQAIAYFGQYTGGEYGFNPFLALPPPGTCTVYVSTGDPDFGAGRTAAKDLSAGNISVAPPAGPAMTTASITEGVRYDFGLFGLSPAIPGIAAIPPFFNPGAFKVSAPGSPDVGAFSVTVPVAPAISWTNRNAAASVDRTQPLTLTWTGSGTVFIRGGNLDYPTHSGGEFICAVPAGASSFTIPPYILQALPDTRADIASSKGYVEIHAMPAGSPVAIKADKLAAGSVQFDYVDRRSAIFK